MPRRKFIWPGKQIKPEDVVLDCEIREVGMTTTEYERHLYVPNAKTVSWDAQLDHAFRMMREGHTVYMHRHAWGDKCNTSVAPEESCVVTDLTAPSDALKLVPVGEAQSSTAEPTKQDINS